MPIKHHFFGKECQIDRQLANRLDLEIKLKEKKFVFDNILFVNQIHSNEVVFVDAASKIHGNQDLPKADAIITNLENIAIAVVTADCCPILLIDEENAVIAAIHAGWRGARADIVQNVVVKMRELSARASKIRAFIGPTVRQKSYEVDAAFLDNFLQENQENKRFFIAGARLNHYMFDLPSYVKNKLNLQGITEIFDEEIDTYSSKDFYSYRRSTHEALSRQEEFKDCGRNVSLVVLNL